MGGSERTALFLHYEQNQRNTAEKKEKKTAPETIDPDPKQHSGSPFLCRHRSGRMDFPP